MDPFSPFLPTPSKNDKVEAGKYKDTLITFLLDQSRSMAGCFDATVSGFNEYIGTMKRKKPGCCAFTLIKFSSGKAIEVPCENMPIEQVPDLSLTNYMPEGGTPLHDSIMEAIVRAEKAVGGKDMNVIIVIQTDGQENASQRYSLKEVHGAIQKHQKNGWGFVFLGADIDAYATSHQYGIATANTMSYGKEVLATRAMFTGTASNSLNVMATASMCNLAYSDSQKLAAGDQFFNKNKKIERGKNPLNTKA